jgi:hypothetical protein
MEARDPDPHRPRGQLQGASDRRHGLSLGRAQADRRPARQPHRCRLGCGHALQLCTFRAAQVTDGQRQRHTS